MTLRVSTGAVASYIAKCKFGPDLPNTIPEADDFRYWYVQKGHQVFSKWENGNVWGSDFRDASFGDPDRGDLQLNGGSDVPDLYYFTGHGSCAAGDYFIVCGNYGQPDDDAIGTSSRWGTITGGNLKFMLIDSSCPMELSKLSTWFPAFQGLHIATGNSGDSNHDTLDSVTRGDQFGAYTAGGSAPGFPAVPQLSVGDAWMRTGIIEVQDGCCAVILAAGVDRSDAIDRRENERVTDDRPDPTPNWFAWKWICTE